MGRVSVDLRHLIELRHQARHLPLSSAGVINSVLVGRHRSRIRGRGLNFEELRHYRTGDDIRLLDWKVTRRTGKPHVRVYAEERERPVLLVVDQRLSMFFGSSRAMKSVVAAELASVLAWHTLAQDDRVGSLVFGDDYISELRPRRSDAQVMQLLQRLQQSNEALRGQTQRGNPAQLNRALQQVLNLAGHGCVVYLLSDLDGADETTGHLLSQLTRHNSVLLGFVYDRLEQQLPVSGRLAVSDGEFQVEIDTADAGLRERFSELFEKRLWRARRFLQQRQVPVLAIHTHEPVVKQLTRMLGSVP
ncbi:DUF58 domain-containing protein [Pseudomaricurvus alkylphenolicus]|uniref:DUF58 domain-containing protein n=1 Tax=Pseudomaricurvus alkylphenolicus TaxID=1306991 RepID=UPI0014222B78|nr:DUF58 domain-containing protein [Pseudomaricurvus alkylphenolicus]NIB42871.1 DUF58 domain-containing protein [Pseudomaricurvus alkylphenolicus]